jgi:hypothetical protein
VGYTKTIVCLANSTKNGGKCIAGREVLGKGYGGWIRPVSARPTAEVSHSEYRYETLGFCQLLDVVDIPLLRHGPHGHQTENHVIDTDTHWVRAGRATWQDLADLIERPASLWLNGTHTQSGLNDCVSLDDTSALDNSLALIKPEAFTLHLGTEHPGRPWAKQGLRGNFRYCGVDYSLRVTDPTVDYIFRSKGDGDYPANDVYLCVSLTEPFDDNRCHKLVAAVFSERSLR